MSVTRVKRSRYQVEKVIQVSCTDCNEHLEDHDYATQEAADQAIRAHEEEYHASDGPR